jgi:hypothetical protein
MIVFLTAEQYHFCLIAMLQASKDPFFGDQGRVMLQHKVARAQNVISLMSIKVLVLMIYAMDYDPHMITRTVGIKHAIKNLPTSCMNCKIP